MSAPFYAWLNLLHVLQVPRVVIMMDPAEALFMRLTQARVSAPCWRAGLIVSSQGRAALYALMRMSRGGSGNVPRRPSCCNEQAALRHRRSMARAVFFWRKKALKRSKSGSTRS